MARPRYEGGWATTVYRHSVRENEENGGDRYCRGGLGSPSREVRLSDRRKEKKKKAGNVGGSGGLYCFEQTQTASRVGVTRQQRHSNCDLESENQDSERKEKGGE
jgi:hypothetical protein